MKWNAGKHTSSAPFPCSVPLHTNYKKLTKPPAAKPTAVFYGLLMKLYGIIKPIRIFTIKNASRA
jgi:hypothetical protein